VRLEVLAAVALEINISRDVTSYVLIDQELDDSGEGLMEGYYALAK
jgi:hypothetical protein